VGKTKRLSIQEIAIAKATVNKVPCNLWHLSAGLLLTSNSLILFKLPPIVTFTNPGADQIRGQDIRRFLS
jgi:hypothetical protein